MSARRIVVLGGGFAGLWSAAGAARKLVDEVLGPIGVRRVEGEVASLDLAGQAVTVSTTGGPRTLPYDRLVFALGINCQRIYPPLTGNRDEILAAAARIVQPPPGVFPR